MNTKSYTPIVDNGFVGNGSDPLPTFSIDVDASTSNDFCFATAVAGYGLLLKNNPGS
jgi:hypothetical protein